jgi:phosphonate transport system ATP-binding protein
MGEKARALMNLKRLGLLHYAHKRADELSGGEQQRIAIARTLMQNPSVILADEPVSNLDPKMSRVILDILKQICLEDGITVVVSLHTLEFARAYADRIVALKDGKIFFAGGVEELTETVVVQIF